MTRRQRIPERILHPAVRCSRMERAWEWLLLAVFVVMLAAGLLEMGAL